MRGQVSRFTVPLGPVTTGSFLLLWLPYALAPFWLVIMVVVKAFSGETFVYWESSGVRYDGLEIQALGFLFVLACSTGVWYHCAMLLRAYIRRCGDIIVDEQDIVGYDSFGREFSMRLAELEVLEFKPWPWNEWRLIDTGGKIFYPAPTDNFGAMLELILDRAENIKSVSFGKESTLANIEVWRKKPDVELIERVRRRAEENRKKVENLTA